MRVRTADMQDLEPAGLVGRVMHAYHQYLCNFSLHPTYVPLHCLGLFWRFIFLSTNIILIVPGFVSLVDLLFCLFITPSRNWPAPTLANACRLWYEAATYLDGKAKEAQSKVRI